MRNVLAILFLLVTVSVSGQSDEAALERALFDLPGVQFKKISRPEDKYIKYLLQIKQPVDHYDPAKGYFYQGAILTHKGFDKPVVMETEGYGMRNTGNEIEKILDANNINVEFRYFNASRPSPIQWQFCTFDEALADLHSINILLRNIYKGKYVSTGISRGGETSIFYKCYYPADVDVAVPYVAPVPNSSEDKRIYKFLDTIGSQECRKKIFDFQEFLIKNYDKALDKFKWYLKGDRFTTDYFKSPENAFEILVLEYSFSFWQWGNNCNDIPVNENVDDYLIHLLKVAGAEYVSDQGVAKFVVHNYMAATEMGYYGYDISKFKKYLRYNKTVNPTAAFVPDSLGKIVFNGAFIKNIQTTLKEKGNNILYVYGGLDTWSACRVEPSAKVNSKSFIVPGTGHGTARIKNMSTGMQKEFAEKLAELSGLKVDLEALK
jgi:hypothetical protein